MARKHSALLKLDKDLAEGLFGHRRGRPTISRRAGKQIGRALGVGTEAGTDIFHLVLLGVGLKWMATTANAKQSQVAGKV